MVGRTVERGQSVDVISRLQAVTRGVRLGRPWLIQHQVLEGQ
jgi:hypothetical protein